ncbi:hypothetical protein ACIGXI_00085 [Kitasatospora aureofaciens]|uniref:hypothetical protein n=1 Tax=Kitasatospora aureofaciens TaxID=1894 RepID=UPI0037C79EE4
MSADHRSPAPGADPSDPAALVRTFGYLKLVSVVVAYVLTLRIGPSGAGASTPVVRG